MLKRSIFMFFMVAIIGLSPIIAHLLCFTSGNFACDFITQVVPLIIEAKKMFGTGWPLWSWNSFLGDNFIGANSYYVIGNPFAYLCCLFPYEYIRIGLVLCLIIQYILFAVSSMLYFRRMGFDENHSVLGALMYAFSSHMINVMFYFIFANSIILFPILLICIENLIDKRRYSFCLLSLLIGCMILCNFYTAAISLLGGGIYLLFRLGRQTNFEKVKTLFKSALAVTLGMAISSVIFIPTVLCTFGTERNAISDFQYGLFDIIYFAITKIVYIILPRLSEGTEAIYQPYSSYALYIPCIGFCFVVEYCRKNWKSWLTWLIVCYLVILLTPLNIVFAIGANLFYGRWCYIILLMCILASLHVIRDNDITKKGVVGYVIGVLIILLILFFYLYRINAYFVSGIDVEILLELVLFIVGCGILILATFVMEKQKVVYFGVTLIGAANLFLYSHILVNRDKDGDYNQIVNNSYPRNHSDEFRYRTDVTSKERNIGYVLNKGVPSQFHSVFNKSIIDLGRCYRIGSMPSIFITHHKESFDALVSVKDVIVYKNDTLPFPLHKVVEKGDNYTVYENDNYVPIGFAYDSFITEDNFKRQVGKIDYENPQNNKDVGLGLLQALVVTEEDAGALKKYLTEIGNVDFEASLDSVVNCRRKHTALDFIGDSKGFKAKINNHSGVEIVYFFSVPNDPGFTACLDRNKELKIFRANLGMMAIVVPPGIHTIDFSYLTPGLKIGALISLFGVIILIVFSLLEYRRLTRSNNTRNLDS